MSQDNKKTLLRVEREREKVIVEMTGTGDDVLKNWAIATSNVCEKLGMPPFALGAALPEMVRAVHIAKGEAIMIDKEALRKERA